MEKEENVYDVVIAGAGPAGLTAALYAVRAGMKTLLVSRTLGGTANSIINLENWPGYKGTGIELMKSFYEQLKGYSIEVILDDVQSIEKKGKDFSVKTPDKEIYTRTIILATGMKRGDLKIPGEERLKGKGVSYCVTCDAFFFKNKIVAFIVKEDTNAEEIIALANVAQKVYVLCNKKIKYEKELIPFIKKDKIEIIYNVIPQEISGEEKVESLWIKDTNGERELKVDGIFIEIGSTPLTEFTKKVGLKLDKDKFILVNKDMETLTEGIFAAGDVTNSKLKQVLTASSQGAIAAKSAGDFLGK